MSSDPYRRNERMSSDPEELLSEGLERLGFYPDAASIDLFMIYLHEIKRWNRKVRIVAEAEDSLLVVRHVLDSLAVRPLLEELRGLRKNGGENRHDVYDKGGSVVRGELFEAADLGSGGGFPGIPLALVYPDLQVDLVERKSKKAVFLRSVVGLLGLGERLRVRDSDVAELSAGYPLLFCRAFRPFAEAMEAAARLTESGGRFIFYGGKKSRIEAEIERLSGACRYRELRIEPIEVPFLEEERHAAVVSF